MAGGAFSFLASRGAPSPTNYAPSLCAAFPGGLGWASEREAGSPVRALRAAPAAQPRGGGAGTSNGRTSCSPQCRASGEEGKPLELPAQQRPQKQLSPLESEEKAQACSLVNLLMSRVADVEVHPRTSGRVPGRGARVSFQVEEPGGPCEEGTFWVLAGQARPTPVHRFRGLRGRGRQEPGSTSGGVGPREPRDLFISPTVLPSDRGKMQRTQSGLEPCSCPSRTKTQ